MEGIKEAIAYITGLAVKAEKPETIEINGRTYCTKDLRRYDAADKAEPIKATTLTSLVDYIKESREELRDRMIIQVVSATKVLLYSGLLAERDRETLFEVNALLPQFEYGREYDQESFLVAMQSCFQKTDDRLVKEQGAKMLCTECAIKAGLLSPFRKECPNRAQRRRAKRERRK